MDLFILVFIFLIGVCLGSFYCCIGYRIPNMISIIKPDSHCSKCKKTLKWYMNIPILSYIILKGRCAYCNEKIGIIHPIIELATGLLFIISYINFSFSSNFFISIILCSVFIIVVVSDCLYYFISDKILFAGLFFLIINSMINYGFLVTFYCILSGLASFLFMYLIKIIGDKIFKKESLGGGDIKLMFVIGFVNGIIGSLYTLFFASLIALPFALFVVKKKNKSIIPFGPFLLASAIIVFFFKESLLNILNYIIY